LKHLDIGRHGCVLAIAAALTLAGCGGNKAANSTTSTSGQMRTESQRETNALPMTQMARVPRGLHCGASRPVWVNTRRKTYHEAGDPYYGRTRNGQFMCADAAVSAGYRLAGTRRGGMRGSEHGVDNGADVNGTDNGGNMNGDNTTHRRHRKHSTTTY